jgi:uncharacterized protein DUF6603
MATTGTTIELILSLEVAGVPLKAHGSVGNGELEELSGLVTIQKSLNEFLDNLNPNFGDASKILKQLTGGSDIKLDSLAVGYRNREPKFAQMAVSLTAGPSHCRFVCLKRMGKDGFVAGLELQLDQALFKNNPFVGLVGEISLGDIGMYYASDAFQDVDYDPEWDFQDASILNLRTESENPTTKSRRFTKGLNWSGQIFAGGINLLDLSGIAGPKKTDSGALTAPVANTPGPNAPQPAQLTNTTAWIELDKSVGPLSVRRIGFSYEEQRVAIKFDVSLTLSVLKLSLEGFGLSYPLDKFSELKESPLKFFDYLRFQLEGAAVSFEQGPLSISGGLLKVSKPYLQLDGTLLIKIPGLAVSAIASYADLNGTPSFFAFATLIMELGDPTATGFFFITGLAFGFGLNRALKLPIINEVQNFPLIKAATDDTYLGTKLDLREISRKLEYYVSPSAGDFWVAAGVRFTSYGQIDSFVLLSVSFGTQLQVAMLGLSRIQIPKPPAPVLVSAELAIRVVIAPDAGLLSFEARLTENSYLLCKEAKLRGGFAFYTWFAGEYAGDFVLSLGGYHPRFLPPAHYPRPDLVQFYCKIGEVTFQGSCYFAFCPSAVMAGASLSLVYQSGGIKAWFVAIAHFLVQWKPLHYDIEIGISVGVSLSLGTDTRTALTIELSASLNLYGPPLGGEARISLFVVTFTVGFGESKRLPPPLIWESSESEKSFAKSFLMNPDVTRVLLVDGLLEEVQQASGTVRFVNPHRLRISCRAQVPATAILYNDDDPAKSQDVKVNGRAPSGSQPWWNHKIGVRPMAKSECYSLLNVTFEPTDIGSSDRLKTMREYLKQYVEISLTTGKVPSALWATDELNTSVPSQNQMVENALLGLEIKTKEGPRPWEVPPIDLEVLAYDQFAKSCRFADVVPRESLPDYGDKTISTTVGAAAVIARRKAILEVLRKGGRRIMKPEEIQLTQLQDHATAIFQATPQMARAGQYPPRGYLET